MSGCEAKVPALRFKVTPAGNAEKAEGGRLSLTAENTARVPTRPPAPWETKRLGDVADYSLEKNSKMETTEAFTNSAEHGIISQLDFFDFDVAKRLSRYSLVRPDDFVYNPRISTSAPFGPINRNELGRCGAMSPLYSVFRCHDIDLDYLQVYFKTDCWHDFMRFNGDTGARFDRFSIRNDLFLDMPVFVPTTQIEQRRIGTFFRLLDALIAGREKALEKLEALKKSMLLKMFPRGDATVPEVRFKGFAGDWEKKRLGDVAKRITRKNTKLESELPLTISAEHGLIDQYEFFNNRVAARDVSGYYLVCRGEFAYNKSTSDGWPWGVVKQLKYYPMGVLSTLYIVFAINEKELDAEYVEKYFETTLWHYDVSIRAAEGARNHGLLNITASDFLETTLLTPSLPEQQKIGAYFRSLDALLASRREEIGKLKQMKKALLERMFV